MWCRGAQLQIQNNRDPTRSCSNIGMLQKIKNSTISPMNKQSKCFATKWTLVKIEPFYCNVAPICCDFEPLRCDVALNCCDFAPICCDAAPFYDIIALPCYDATLFCYDYQTAALRCRIDLLWFRTSTVEHRTVLLQTLGNKNTNSQSGLHFGVKPWLF